MLLENPGARPLVEIQNDLGVQVSSGLKANHSVVVISWGMKKGLLCFERFRNTFKTCIGVAAAHAASGRGARCRVGPNAVFIRTHECV